MTEDIDKARELIVSRFWTNASDADYSARNVFLSSLVRFPANELDTDILRLVKDGDLTYLAISNIVQKHKNDIDSRLSQAIFKFSEFFNHYSGKESIISMCLFGPSLLDKEIRVKLDNMLAWYARDQIAKWEVMGGEFVGHADIYTGWEALKWFLSGVVVTGILWDLTKRTITELFYKAQEMTNKSALFDDSELYQRIDLLDLSPAEIEQISSNWFSNFQRFFLSLSADEKKFVHRLTRGSISKSRSPEAPESLRKMGYLCTIENNPGEEFITLFPESIRFF